MAELCAPPHTSLHPTIAPAIAQSPEKSQGKHMTAELKNGKVSFKQKPMSLEKLSETLQEIVKFREMVEQCIEKQAPPLQTIPDQYLPLIAKLGHESDKTLAALAKHIQKELMPPQDEDEESTTFSSAQSILPLQTVEQAIKSTLYRNNYGIDAPNGGRTPAGVCVWRWEVAECHRDWLPKSVKEKAEARLSERVQAKEYLRRVFEALPQSERDAILNPKGTNRGTAKDTSDKPVDQPLATKPDNERSTTPLKSPSKDIQADQNKQSESPNDNPSRPKKIDDPEKPAKEKERLDKKVAKAERERKAKDAQNKSRTIMANFFIKPKKSVASGTERGTSGAGPSRIQTDFERTFKPFVLKKGVTLAPPNWFKVPKKRRGKETARANASGIIVIDSENESDKDSKKVVVRHAQPVLDVRTMTVQERLRTILNSLPHPIDPSKLLRPRRRGCNLQFKTYHPYSIRDLMMKLTEAEVAGDDNDVRILLNQLQDRDLYPAKVFIYHEDARPGYFGTWTRSSKTIGPRTPFIKDVVEFDYGYDSGAEWEEEHVGDADDVLEDEEEEGDSDEADSDMDSWLVDDDKEPEIPYEDFRDPSPPTLRDLSPMPPPSLPPKRKAADPEKKSKKRKIVVPLVPFTKGPCWEARIGECEYEPFNQYRIQAFNDTPFPVDPFTFASTCVEDYRANLKSSTQPHAVSDAFAVPSLPEHVTALSADPVKKPAVKYPFPDAHLPFLLNKITELQMSSLVLLVETIYHDLKAHKVKKNAIEAKIREVGDKCKEKKVWIVKPALKPMQS